jgi:hypothetical protein
MSRYFRCQLCEDFWHPNTINMIDINACSRKQWKVFDRFRSHKEHSAICSTSTGWKFLSCASAWEKTCHHVAGRGCTEIYWAPFYHRLGWFGGHQRASCEARGWKPMLSKKEASHWGCLRDLPTGCPWASTRQETNRWSDGRGKGRVVSVASTDCINLGVAAVVSILLTSSYRGSQSARTCCSTTNLIFHPLGSPSTFKSRAHATLGKKLWGQRPGSWDKHLI